MRRRISPWVSWSPEDYYRQYYSQSVPPDEEQALTFQIDLLRHSQREYSSALEYGCGPTLLRSIAASRYAGSLDMADRLEGNLRQVRRWLVGEPGADDWTPF